jgi:hypothetical protein
MRALIERIQSLTRPRSCPVPSVACPAAARRWKLLRLVLPLVSFVVPTVVVAYGVLIPRSCIAGLNELSFGFGTTVLGACITYVFGVRAALKG